MDPIKVNNKKYNEAYPLSSLFPQIPIKKKTGITNNSNNI